MKCRHSRIRIGINDDCLEKTLFAHVSMWGSDKRSELPMWGQHLKLHWYCSSWGNEKQQRFSSTAVGTNDERKLYSEYVYSIILKTLIKIVLTDASWPLLKCSENIKDSVTIWQMKRREVFKLLFYTNSRHKPRASHRFIIKVPLGMTIRLLLLHSIKDHFYSSYRAGQVLTLSKKIENELQSYSVMLV